MSRVAFISSGLIASPLARAGDCGNAVEANERTARVDEYRAMGVENPRAHAGAADRLRVLILVDRSSALDAKEIRSFEQRLDACLKTGKKCEVVYEAIDKAFVAEQKARALKVEALERRLEDLGLSDESRLEEVDAYLARLKACRELSDSADCRQTIRLASEFAQPADVQKQPGAVSKAPRFSTTATPNQEVQKLTLLSTVQKNQLLEIYGRTRNSSSAQRELVLQSANREKERPRLMPDSLDAALRKYLGSDVEVKPENSKAAIFSADGERKVVLDPAVRYFTTWKRDTASGEWIRAYFHRDYAGNFYEIPRPTNFVDQFHGSHYGY